MKRVLICPLDWGLGHATRSIPVIWELQRQCAEVLIASSGPALQLLKQEFPGLTFFELPPYQPIYHDQESMMGRMVKQVPKFLKALRDEHLLVEKLVRENSIDIVISDNRYGCWSSKARSVFVTHQVNILLPTGAGWLSPMVNFLLQRYILKFQEVWIPDQPGSGLTAPFTSRGFPNQKFVGWLSRFQSRDGVRLKYEIVAVVSGPDPQRTIFRDLLITQLKASGLKSLLVAGEPGNSYRTQEGSLETVNHLPAAELEEAILSAGLVISRSGYSTVMDLIFLGKKAAFVPTPQQPEQIFLARHLLENGIAFSEDQHLFSLGDVLEKAKRFKGLSEYSPETGLLQKEVSILLK